MTRIGLISDTHNFLHPDIESHFASCDEIWHAGDFGSLEVANNLEEIKPIKGVWGNIDGQDLRARFPQTLIWTCEEVKIFMTHIGGYPNRYAPGIRQQLQKEKPALFISGHSHILKIMFDESLQCLHMNPGAAGNQGWHKVKTLIRFTIDGSDMKDCQVIEI